MSFSLSLLFSLSLPVPVSLFCYKLLSLALSLYLSIYVKLSYTSLFVTLSYLSFSSFLFFTLFSPIRDILCPKCLTTGGYRRNGQITPNILLSMSYGHQTYFLHLSNKCSASADVPVPWCLYYVETQNTLRKFEG